MQKWLIYKADERQRSLLLFQGYADLCTMCASAAQNRIQIARPLTDAQRAQKAQVPRNDTRTPIMAMEFSQGEIELPHNIKRPV